MSFSVTLACIRDGLVLAARNLSSHFATFLGLSMVFPTIGHGPGLNVICYFIRTQGKNPLSMTYQVGFVSTYFVQAYLKGSYDFCG
jgi:hypothetical protein